MKKTILALSLFSGFCVASLSSCNKIRESLFPAFTVQLDEVTTTIPIMLGGVQSSTSSTVSFNLDSTIRANTGNAFGINALSSVKVKDLTVSLNNSDGLNDLSNFETVSVKFSSNTVNTPATIADATIPDTPATTINISAPEEPELKEYLKGSQLTYTVTTMARRTTTKPLQAGVSVTLSVK